jgi:hypothetical protein
MAESWNVGRTDWNFQCCVRAINGLFCRSFLEVSLAVDGSGTAGKDNVAGNKKAGARPAFS